MDLTALLCSMGRRELLLLSNSQQAAAWEARGSDHAAAREEARVVKVAKAAAAKL